MTVDEVPLFGAAMHPRYCVLAGHSEKDGGDWKVIISAYSEQHQYIAGHLLQPVRDNHSLLTFAVTPNSSVKITKYDDLVICQSGLHDGFDVLNERLLFSIAIGQGGCTGTDDGHLSCASEREAKLYQVGIDSSGEFN